MLGYSFYEVIFVVISPFGSREVKPGQRPSKGAMLVFLVF